MATEDAHALWAKDEQLLAQIGRFLYDQPTRIQVRLPRRLAEAALAAWERDDGEYPLPQETTQQRQIRHRAATLSLIGLCVESRGIDDGDDVIVELDAWHVGLALEAADDAGLLEGLSPTDR